MRKNLRAPYESPHSEENLIRMESALLANSPTGESFKDQTSYDDSIFDNWVWEH